MEFSLEVEYFSGFEMQLRKSLMVKRRLLHVKEKEGLKDCRKRLKTSCTSTLQGQQRSESSQAAVVCLPFGEIMDRYLCHGSVPSNQVSDVQVWVVESYSTIIEPHPGYQDELCSMTLQVPLFSKLHKKLPNFQNYQQSRAY